MQVSDRYEANKLAIHFGAILLHYGNGCSMHMNLFMLWLYAMQLFLNMYSMQNQSK